jgi:hypothetical protein
MKPILFRCSSWADLMTDPKTKAQKEAGDLSETAKALCIETWISHKYGIKKDITNKYLEKGIASEEDAITLLSKVDKTFYVNNKARMSNEFITGEWDILKDSHVIDIKSSWDAFTFFKHLKDTELDKKYYWQLQGYMALTGAKTSEVCYCLVDTPDHLIEKEITNLWYKLGQIDQESSQWIEAETEARNNMKFSDKIEAADRVIRFKIDRNDEDIQKGYERVEQARQWIKNNLN